MDKFGADGDVIEINLTTVKVGILTTLQLLYLLTVWVLILSKLEGMLNSDGRRIKRHVLIKTSSIRFLNDSELDNLKNRSYYYT
jgi:miniconductance mechanosensitive channel